MHIDYWSDRRPIEKVLDMLARARTDLRGLPESPGCAPNVSEKSRAIAQLRLVAVTILGAVMAGLTALFVYESAVSDFRKSEAAEAFTRATDLRESTIEVSYRPSKVGATGWWMHRTGEAPDLRIADLNRYFHRWNPYQIDLVALADRLNSRRAEGVQKFDDRGNLEINFKLPAIESISRPELFSFVDVPAPNKYWVRFWRYLITGLLVTAFGAILWISRSTWMAFIDLCLGKDPNRSFEPMPSKESADESKPAVANDKEIRNPR